MKKIKMNKNTFTVFVLFGALVSLSFYLPQISFSQMADLELKVPAAGGENYDGETKGTLDITDRNGTINLTAKMFEPPAGDDVYEGWFEDKGQASGYSLSLGKFDESNTLTVNQTMVNPYTYTIFYVTAEPSDDVDPNPSDIVVGTQLPSPFGQ
jgi:hypothetical protein